MFDKEELKCYLMSKTTLGMCTDVETVEFKVCLFAMGDKSLSVIAFDKLCLVNKKTNEADSWFVERGRPVTISHELHRILDEMWQETKKPWPVVS